MVDRQLYDDLRKLYLHLKAPRFDLHRLHARAPSSVLSVCEAVRARARSPRRGAVRSRGASTSVLECVTPPPRGRVRGA
jgi:hypothetical protein